MDVHAPRNHFVWVEIVLANVVSFLSKLKRREIRALACVTIYAATHSPSAQAQWDFSLATKIAMYDVIISTCGKVEPRLTPLLNDQWAALVNAYGTGPIDAARRSPDYVRDYQWALYEQLEATWGDSDEQAHECERILTRLNRDPVETNPWWRDRACVDVPLNSLDESDKKHQCGVGPSAEVGFANIAGGTRISILRVAPSSDVSFPRAGVVPLSTTAGGRIVLPDDGNRWAIPDSVEFEWKQWPKKRPEELDQERDLNALRAYVDRIREKTHRQRSTLMVRSQIPNDIIAESLRTDEAATLSQAEAPRLKLQFIFVQDGLRFRWEEWRGDCINRYGGDEIKLPRQQLLSSDRVCGDSRQQRKKNPR